MHSILHDPLITPENRLWRAVLEQAYADAESGCDPADVSDDVADGPPERICARCYLRGDNKQDAASLVMVCGFAEVPADRVLNWARRNYPRPKTNALTQNAHIVGVTEAWQRRAHSSEHASA
jgi:hypothetical protein